MLHLREVVLFQSVSKIPAKIFKMEPFSAVLPMSGRFSCELKRVSGCSCSFPLASSRLSPNEAFWLGCSRLDTRFRSLLLLLSLEYLTNTSLVVWRPSIVFMCTFIVEATPSYAVTLMPVHRTWFVLKSFAEMHALYQEPCLMRGCWGLAMRTMRYLLMNWS